MFGKRKAGLAGRKQLCLQQHRGKLVKQLGSNCAYTDTDQHSDGMRDMKLHELMERKNSVHNDTLEV